mgnify:CR=1 FL=1
MKKLIFGKHNMSISMASVFFIIETVVCFLICIFCVVRMGVADSSGNRMYLYLCIFSAVVFAVCVFFFIRSVLLVIRDMEKKTRILKEEYGNEQQGEQSTQEEFISTIRSLIQREATADMMRKQAEIEALQNQINPHFLYNTLETIRGQAIVAGNREIAETTKALADIFRYNISKKGSVVTLKEELDNIQAYMYIQRLRFNARFDLKINVPEETMTLKIPKLIIQPVVENSLKHGLEPKIGQGRIMIQAFRTEEALFIIVEDDGIGMDIKKLKMLRKRMQGKDNTETASERSAHVGLVNVSERIRMIYGNWYGISVESIPNAGTKVQLVLGILA